MNVFLIAIIIGLVAGIGIAGAKFTG